jgi:2-oxoglutarate dehydrogenase E2 component (dihydrolipoamide succinyltransferase)
MSELVVPKLGESISEAVIAKWLKQVGETTAVDEPVVDLETDKVSVSLPAPAAGVLTEQRFAAGTTVRVGDVIGTIGPASANAPAPVKAAPSAPAPVEVPVPVRAESTVKIPAPAPAPVATRVDGTARHASPAMRKAMREHPQEIAAPAPAPAPIARGAITPVAPRPAGPDEEVVPMTPLRRTIAARLVEAQRTAAILTTFNEVDLSHVMALRARFQDQFVARHGVKLGFMSFFAKACVESLRAFPGLNAELRGTDIIYKKRYHFGVAVGSGRGLVVPVVRDVDQKNFGEIERTIAELATRAKENKLTLDELSGGTFTITNGGVYGSMLSTPLLNMPQTGILGMHNIVKRPIAVGDEIALRPMMYIALSYDHRVVDGREAVQFLVGVKERLEAPERLMLEI